VTNGIEQHDWDFLIRRIKNSECVAILGPEVSYGLVESRRDLAAHWIKKHNCPLAETSTLAQVAQFLAFRNFELFPKDEMQRHLQNIADPDFNQGNLPHTILARLKLPVYITTNYDDLLFKAISHERQLPSREIYRWNELLARRNSALSLDLPPTPATPLVFHLHGHLDRPESMVLTEDDYLTFLLNIRSENYPIPPTVKQAISESSLLILGYHPAAWDFRVLIRGLIQTTDPQLRRLSVTVQIPQADDEASQQELENYINTYLRRIDSNMRVYWGTTRTFLAELQQQLTGKTAGSTSSPQPDVNPVRMFRLMYQHFEKEELITLSFMLGIEDEDLPEPKKSFTRELIRTAQNRQRLPELLELCRQERPLVEW
jgi:hypothetical protein